MEIKLTGTTEMSLGDEALRDLFAALAMAAMIGNQVCREDVRESGVAEEKAIAHYAYEQADAMIAEREK